MPQSLPEYFLVVLMKDFFSICLVTQSGIFRVKKYFQSQENLIPHSGRVQDLQENRHISLKTTYLIIILLAKISLFYETTIEEHIFLQLKGI